MSIIIADIVICHLGSIYFGLVIASTDRNITSSLCSDTKSPLTQNLEGERE